MKTVSPFLGGKHSLAKGRGQAQLFRHKIHKLNNPGNPGD